MINLEVYVIKLYEKIGNGYGEKLVANSPYPAMLSEYANHTFPNQVIMNCLTKLTDVKLF